MFENCVSELLLHQLMGECVCGTRLGQGGSLLLVEGEEEKC